MSKLPLKREFPKYCCPYCGQQVGYVGRLFAAIFGTQIHGCDFSNVNTTPRIREFLKRNPQ